MNLFPIITNQMGMLAVYLVIGIIGVKTKIFDKEALNYLSKYIMKLSLPIMIFTNTLNGATAKEVIDTLPMLAMAIGMFLILFCVGTLFSGVFRLEGDRKQVYKAVSMFGNVGFVGIPLISAVFPERGMLYIAIFTIIDQGLLWTLGIKLTTPIGDEKNNSIKDSIKKMINPAIVGIIVGVIGIFAGLRLPVILNETFIKVGATTTPLSMIYIGGLFCYVDIKSFIKKVEFYFIVAFKMMIFPVILFLSIKNFAFIGDEIKITLALLGALPSMSSIAMFANANGSDGDYAIGAILVTTVLSIMTLPIVSYLISIIL